MANQPMRQFITPDFAAQPEPQLDWMPWDQMTPKQSGGVKSFMNNMKSEDEPAPAADTAAKAAKGAGMGAASL